MLMRPPLRKLALTVHVISSVGWLGAVVCSLAALAVAGALGSDVATVRAAYVALEVVTPGWRQRTLRSAVAGRAQFSRSGVRLGA
jgi:hypothetical protein